MYYGPMRGVYFIGYTWILVHACSKKKKLKEKNRLNIYERKRTWRKC
jgi:hypothetical protein